MQLSIIVPVYKVEEYIEKCILSLQQQDIAASAYEIIIINDGSPDNSREVVLQLMQSFSNIVFIEQENKGVSLARNAGIDKAGGKYLLFIDADDYIFPNSFARVLQAAKEQQAQVTFLGYTILNADGFIQKEILYKEEKGKAYTGVKAYPVSRGDGTADPDRSWGILYEREFINNHRLRYTANIPILEDGEFIARVCCLAERCIFEGNYFYLRTTRPGSAINSDIIYSKKAINGFVTAADNLSKFQLNRAPGHLQKQFLNQPICKFILLAVNSSLGSEKVFSSTEIITLLHAKGLVKCNLKGCNKYYKRDGFFFNLSPKVYAVYKPIWALIDKTWFRLFKVHP